MSRQICHSRLFKLLCAAYNSLLHSFRSFLQTIKKFRDEELGHLETGLEHNAEKVRTSCLKDTIGLPFNCLESAL